MAEKFKSQRKTGVLLSYAILVTDSVLGIVYTPILLNSLGENEYGLYQLIGSLINYFAVMDLGLGGTITRYFIKYNTENNAKERDNFFAMALIVYSIICVIVLASCGVLGVFVHDIFGSLTLEEVNEARILVMFLAFNLVITLFDHAFSGVLNSFEQFAFDKGLRLSRVILRAILVIVLLQFYSNAVVIVVVDFVLTLSILFAKIIVCTKRIGVKPKLYNWDTPLLKEVFIFTSAIFLQAIINQFNNNVDKTVLGIYKSTAVVAVYSIAMQMYSAFSGISTAIQSVYLPKISKSVFKGADNHAITLSLVQPSRYQLIILSCVCIAFWLFGFEFIYLWCGKTDAWIITCMIMTAGIVELFQNSTTSVLKAKNKLKGRTFINFFTALCNFAITLFLVPKYGMIGAASGTVFTLVIGYILCNNIYYHKCIGIEVGFYFKSVLKGFLVPIIVSILIGLALNHFITGYSWTHFCIKSILFSITYLLLLFAFTFNNVEKGIAVKILRKSHLCK